MLTVDTATAKTPDALETLEKLYKEALPMTAYENPDYLNRFVINRIKGVPLAEFRNRNYISDFRPSQKSKCLLGLDVELYKLEQEKEKKRKKAHEEAAHKEVILGLIPEGEEKPVKAWLRYAIKTGAGIVVKKEHALEQGKFLSFVVSFKGATTTLPVAVYSCEPIKDSGYCQMEIVLRDSKQEFRELLEALPW